MQSTARLHDGVANAILQKAYLVLHHPIAFHTANGVFNTDSDRRDRTIGRCLKWGEFTPTRFLLRLDDGDPVEEKALEAHILVEATALWQSIALQFSQVFIVCLPFTRGTQEADVTGCIDHEEVLDRVALFLATVVFLLIFWIGGAMDRAFGTIMPKRGDVGASFACVVARRVANSSAVRAGSKSWWANARFNSVWRR
jgi:hypothetical protein